MRQKTVNANENFGVYQQSNLQRARKILGNFKKTRLPVRKKQSRMPGLSVIILNLDRPEYIIPLTRQLQAEGKAFAADGIFFEVLIGDTGSRDKSVLAQYKKIQKEKEFRIISGFKYHFSRNNNSIAEKEAKAATLLFLNNDIILDKAHKTLRAMYAEFEKSGGHDIFGPYLHYPDQTIQHAGVYFSRKTENLYFPYHAARGDKVPARMLKNGKVVPAVTGAFLMIAAELFASAGRFDEEFQRECQDISLCLSAHRLGARSVVCNSGKIIHVENGTREANDSSLKDRAYFLRKWSSYIEAGNR